MNLRNWKRMIALAAVMALMTSVLTACGGKTNVDVTEKDTPADLAQNTAAEVATVNNEAITVADLRYYIYSVAMMQLYQMDPAFSGDTSGVDWQQKLESGKTLEETVIEEALATAVNDLLVKQKGAENGISFSEDEKAQADEMINNYVAQFGEETFNLTLTAMGMDSKEAYRKIYELVTTVQKVEEDIQADISKYIDDTEELKKHRSEDKATVQHVLIMSEGGKYENPEDVANEVLEKAKAGEDFAALIEQYNEDPGATAAGYTFGPGEMVAEFEAASFALEYDQISDIVKTDYGYHIIKRLVGSAELQNYWKSQADIKENKDVLASVSVADVINAITDAQMKLQEQSMAESAETAADTGAAETVETTEGESTNG